MVRDCCTSWAKRGEEALLNCDLVMGQAADVKERGVEVVKLLQMLRERAVREAFMLEGDRGRKEGDLETFEKVTESGVACLELGGFCDVCLCFCLVNSDSSRHFQAKCRSSFSVSRLTWVMQSELLCFGFCTSLSFSASWLPVCFLLACRSDGREKLVWG